jgi:hypothetical protein
VSAWTWVLVALCAAGVLAAVIPAISVALAASKISKRVAALKQSRLSLSLQSLTIQSNRLAQLSADAALLVSRAQTAVEAIRANVEIIKMPQARDALAFAGEQIRSLVRDLR